jgi:hypothetical protein
MCGVVKGDMVICYDNYNYDKMTDLSDDDSDKIKDKMITSATIIVSND